MIRLPVAALVLGLLLSGCAGEADVPAAASGSTSAVNADLLSSLTDPGAGMQSSVPVAGGPAAAPADGAPVTLDDLGWDEGDPAAPLRVVEFSDFGCGYCRQFHEQTYPALVREYIESGKVLWKYVPMVLGIFGPNAEAAAVAAECAGEQGRFGSMRDALFSSQREWKDARDAAPALRVQAERSGADMGQWDRCLAEGSQVERVRAGTSLSRQVGVRGTPSFIVVGHTAIPGAIPLEIFREVLDTAYARTVGAGGMQ